MSPQPSDAFASRSWTYCDVASLPLPEAVEEHLLGALRKLTATLDTEGVCEAVLSGVESVFGATSSWIMLHNPVTKTLRTALFRGRGADVYASVEIPVDCGVAGQAFSRGEIQFVPDARRDHRWFDPERVRASGLRSVFLLPLIARHRRIGVLGVDAPQFGTRSPTSADVKCLEIFAAQAAIGLLNARLYAASQQDRNRLRRLLRERRSLRHEVLTLRDEVRNAHAFGNILGETPQLRAVLSEVERVATSDITVLLLGETGTGKELVARALHERSQRNSRPFVPVNCAALPESLVESEMFGHERGAFTGAHLRKPGRFELADRGTLFLDEVGDLPLNAQAKLLRALQDGEVFRVGATAPIKVNARLVAATNHDLSTFVAEGKFREDLFYRLSVFPIRIPPLRERAEDIPLLATHLALQCAHRIGKRISQIEQAAIDALTSYDWPGNVRELQNVIERAVILASSELITADTIRTDGAQNAVRYEKKEPSPAGSLKDGASRDRVQTFADAEREAIVAALRQAEGRVSGQAGAAALLGLRPTTLHAKMKKLGVGRGDALRP